MKLTEYPFTLDEITSWYRSKQRLLVGSPVCLIDIKETTNPWKPAALANFNGTNALGRINGWVSGEFDFEVIRISDGKDIFWRHVDVSVLDELEEAYGDFIRSIQNSGSTD